MKYAHIIYNSSERNQSGAVGFGVRATSPGVTADLIGAIEKADGFSFAEQGETTTPAKLGEDPSLIRGIAPSYFFRIVPLASDTRAFVLGRKIAVGFDYTFYLNGKPGRLGNYVVDAYAFAKAPTAREFEILLESAAEGSNHFIPASPEPHAGNEEMKVISLGHHPELPEEEKPFAATFRPVINKQAIDVLFAYIQSRKEGKPLLVDAPVEAPAPLMAALASIVPQSEIENLTFISNHSEEGKKPGVNIVFINKYYPFEIFPKQWVKLDLNAGVSPDTAESRLFRATLEKYVEEGNLEAVRKLSGWCLSDMYEKGKNFPADTQSMLYNYVYNYPRFEARLDQLASDRNLRETLADYFRVNPEEKARLEDSVANWFDRLEDLNGVWEWIRFVNAVRPIDLEDVVSAKRARLSSAVFESIDSFTRFFNTFKGNLSEAVRFVEDRDFKGHDNYLSAFPGEWNMLYRLFLPEDKTKGAALMGRMFADRVPATVRDGVIAVEIGDSNKLSGVLNEMISERKCESESARLWEERLAQNPACGADFFRLFPERINGGVLSKLYIWQLENMQLRSADDVKRGVDCILMFRECDRMSSWLHEPKAKTTFMRLYNALKERVKDGSLDNRTAFESALNLSTNQYPQDIRTLFGNLYDVLNATSMQGRRDADKVYEVADELGKKEYQVKIIGDAFKAKEANGDRNLHEFVEKVLAQGVASREMILEKTKERTSTRYFYIVGLLLHENLKPQAKLNVLVDEIGMTDEEAMNFLNKYTYFREDHDKIVKSRKPGLFGKIGSLFKKKEDKSQPSAKEDKNRKETKARR